MKQITDRIIQRTSEIKAQFKANKTSSDALKSTILKSLDSSVKNTKDIKEAQKNKQISDDRAQSATFLNNINKVLNESLASADSKTLDSINKNLQDIKKLISDYTKSSIDKQDTSISYTDPTRKSSTANAKAGKSSNTGKDKDSKEGSGIWDFIKGLFLGALAFLGSKVLLGAFRALVKLGKGIYELGKGAVSAIIKGFEFIKTHGAKLVNIITKPIEWFKTTIWPSVAGWLKGLISKIPGAGAVVKQLDKISNTAQAVKSAGLMKTLKDAGGWVVDKGSAGFKYVKGKVSGAVVKFASGLAEKFPFLKDAYNGLVSAGKKLAQPMKTIFQKIYRILMLAKDVGTKGASVVAKFGGKLGSKLLGILSTIAKKALGKAIGLITALATGPIGCFISILMAGWLAFDFARYIWSYKDKYDILSFELLSAATVFAFVGIDILGDSDDKELWELVEPLTPAEANKLSANLTSSTIRTATQAQRENIAKQLEAEYSGYQSKYNSLYNRKITYKDSNGNVLSEEDSAKIQALELERANLLAQRASIQREYTERHNNPNFYKGEVEISNDKEKFKKLVDYFYDEFNDGNFFKNHFLQGNKDPRAEMENHLASARKYRNEGNILEAAKEYAKAQIYESILAMQASGLSEKEIYAAIENSNRYNTISEQMDAINIRLNETAAGLSDFAGYSEHSSVDISRNNLSEASGLGTSKAVRAADIALSRAGTDSKHRCAEFVNKAIFEGGYRNYGNGSGKGGHGWQVGTSLAAIGWRPTGAPFKVGDVAVFDRAQSTNPTYGHAAILTRQGWVSDFKQREMSPYSNKAESYKHATVYRDNGFITASTPLTNTYIRGNMMGSGSTSSQLATQQPVIIQQSAPQQVESTVDLTEYWSLLPM